MQLPYSEYVAAVRREGSALHAAAAQGLDAPVPTCPDWIVGDLVAHISGVYARVDNILETRATAQPEVPATVPDGDLLAVFGDLLDEVVGQLSNASHDTPVWNWSGTDQTAAFYARRLAHESSIHRYDAQRAHEVAEPIAPDLAGDGIDEMIDILIPGILARDHVTLTINGVVTLDSSDDGAWVLHVSPSGVERLEVAPADPTVASGTTSALLLAVTGRIPWSALRVTGDTAPLHGWAETFRF